MKSRLSISCTLFLSSSKVQISDAGVPCVKRERGCGREREKEEGEERERDKERETEIERV